MPGVVVIGSLNVDLVLLVDRMPHSGETVTGRDFARHAGGKGLNQAIAAARSGEPVHLAGAVGDDDGGRWLRSIVRGEGISDDHLVTADVPTGTALIEVDATGANRIVVIPGANGLLTREHARAAVPSGAGVVLANLEATVEAALAGLVAAREQDLRTVLNPAPVPPDGVPDALLAATDVLVPNEHEASTMTGIDVHDEVTARAAAQVLLQRGAGCVVVTLGERGCIWDDGDAHGTVPAYDVTAVDTTAAGDAFCGTLAASMAAGLPWMDCLRRACAAGGLASTVAGAMPSLPHSDDIDRTVRDGRLRDARLKENP